MNRIASLAAGTVTTALVGASIAAVSASQGVLPSFGSGGEEPAGTWSETAGALAGEWAAAPATAEATAAPAANSTPTVIYVDKEPIVVTEEVVERAPAAPPSADSRGLAAPTAAHEPSPSPAATRPPADGGIVSNGGGAGPVQPVAPPASAPAVPAPAATPPPPGAPGPAAVAPAPAAEPASAAANAGESSQAGGYSGSYGDDRHQEEYEEPEEEHKEEHEEAEEHDEGRRED